MHKKGETLIINVALAKDDFFPLHIDT